MKSVRMEVWRTVVPHEEDRDGPLKPMLIGLTVVSGMLDVFSILDLGHIFVANVTGDVIFIALGMAGARGFSIMASAVTLGVFALGAFIGGHLFTRFGAHRGRVLTVICLSEAVLFAASVIVASMTHGSLAAHDRYTLIVLLALAMGLQNALAFKLAVPGLTTSVLTQAITGIWADNQLAGGTGANTGTRIASALALFVGALAGAVLIHNVNGWTELLTATAVLVAVGLTAAWLSRSDPPWVHRS
jgi:uncharacterized membrane protein YoaK (UPF0700 family)